MSQNGIVWETLIHRSLSGKFFFNKFNLLTPDKTKPSSLPIPWEPLGNIKTDNESVPEFKSRKFFSIILKPRDNGLIGTLS